MATLLSAHSDILFTVNVNEAKTAVFPVNKGCRQGGIISTYMYSLLINDLLLELAGRKLGISLGSHSCGNTTLAAESSLTRIRCRGITNILPITAVCSNI